MQIYNLIKAASSIAAILILTACAANAPKYAFEQPKSKAVQRCAAGCASNLNTCNVAWDAQTNNNDNDDVSDSVIDATTNLAYGDTTMNSDGSTSNNDDTAYSVMEASSKIISHSLQPKSPCQKSFEQCYSSCGVKAVAFASMPLQAQHSLQKIPSGAYQQTCRQCSFNGAKLTCKCLSTSQFIISSTVRYDKSSCSKVINHNGRLYCMV